MQGGELARGNVSTGYLDGTALTPFIADRVQVQLGGGWIGFGGNETPNLYAYQKFVNTQLIITYNHRPTTPALSSPASGSSVHASTVTLSGNSTDADGDPLKYAFYYGTSPSTVRNTWNSGELSTNTFTFNADGLWGQTIYWTMSVHDPYTGWIDTSAVANVTLPDAPPPAPATSTPGEGAVVATTTPTLAVPAVTDPDGDQVLYNFTISGGADTPTGRASSGWQTATSWTVPAGVLADGQSYTWSVATGDGPVPGQPHPGPWKTTAAVIAPHLTVNLRLGTSGPTPADNLGGAAVNLANGNVTVAVAGHTVNTVGGALGVGMTYNSQAGIRTGLLGQYYADYDRRWDFLTAGSPALVRTDPSLDVRWNQAGYAAAPPGLPTEQQLVRWTGYLTLPAGMPSGGYQIGAISDDGVRIWAGTKSSYDPSTADVNQWVSRGAPAVPDMSATVNLATGTPVPVRIDYFNQGGPAQFTLYIKGVDTTTMPAVPLQVTPPAWLAPTVSALPTGWSLSLPGGGGGYTRAAVSSQPAPAGTSAGSTSLSTVPFSAVLTDGEGASHTWFAKPAVTGQATAYTPPAGEDGTLVTDPQGGLVLTDDDGSVYTFNAQGAVTSARSAADALHPAAAVYHYDTTAYPARVDTITDPVSGRVIQLSYGSTTAGTTSFPTCDTPAAGGGFDTALAPNLLCKVSFWDGTATKVWYRGGNLARIEEPGSEITDFAYNADGLLTQVRSPLAADWVAADPTNRAAAPVTTDFAYTWLNPAPAGSATVRPAYSPATRTGGVWPIGAIPVATTVTAPSPDGSTAAARPQHTYTYLDPGGTPSETQLHVAGLSTAVDRDVTYDPTGRTLTDTNATGQSSATTYDAGGQDLPTSSTDAAGRKTTTIYDWAQRPTDTYGPAPAACFQASGFPVASPPASCGVIPHTHTGYDTDIHGTRTTGLETAWWNNTLQSGAPATRSTSTSLSSQPAGVTAAGGAQRDSGEIALAPGTYTFGATVGDPTNDGVRVYIDDQPVLDRWNTTRQAVLADNPTGFWRLNDAAGATTAANSASPGGSPGNPAPVTGPFAFGASARGPVDTATTANLSGSNAQMTLPQGWSSANNHSTIELWFRTVSPGMLFGYQDQPAGTGNVSLHVPGLYVGNSGLLNGDWWGNDALTPMTSTMPVNDGKWHQAVLVGSDTNETLYLDGNPVGPARNTTIASSGMPYAQIGYGSAANGWTDNPNPSGEWTGFSGQIADVATYDHPVTADRVAAHYAAGTAALTGTAQVTFTAPPATAANSLPAAPVSTPHKIRIDYRNPTQTANITLTATPTTGGANGTGGTAGTPAAVSASAFDPRYGLATWTQTDDTGGIGTGVEQTGTSYTGATPTNPTPTLDPVYGLATATVVDPNGTGNATTGYNGLALTRTTNYETPGTGTGTGTGSGGSGYLRPTATALPSGDLTNPAKRTTTTYYGDQETLPSTALCGLAGVNQAGMAHYVTDPTPASGTPVTTETAYDPAGRIAATHVGNDGWTCLTYDTRGRLTTKAIPAIGTNPARTITTTYSVGGNPLVTSVADPSGTVTTTTDLLGRTVRYVDVNGVVTTTAYDQAGRATTVTSTGTGGGTSTLTTGYDDAGKTTAVTLDGLQLATVAYDGTGEISQVTYPAATATTGGNGMTLTGLTEDAAGRDTGSTFTLPGGTTLTDALTRSQAGRVMTDTATTGTPNGNGGTTSTVTAGWTYTYDPADRLTAAVLAAATAAGQGTNATRPTVTFGYGYSPTGGCGADPTAGLDSARTNATVTIGTKATQTTTTCTDNASRLTSNTVTNPTTNTVTAIPATQAVYDGHGNATRLGNQSWTYDGTDRVTTTTATQTATQTGGSASSQKLTYTRDATDRVIKQVGSGTGTGVDTSTQLYGFIDNTDSPEYQLTSSKALGERYLALPGGVLYTRRYTTTGGDTWSLPNLHGDITTTTNNAGAVTTSGIIYDPYGQPLDPTTGLLKTTATPTTRTGPTTDAWEGSHQRGYQHTTGLNQTLMGARAYLPALGIFTTTDPVVGGNSNDYTYPSDPVNGSDLDGKCGFSNPFQPCGPTRINTRLTGRNGSIVLIRQGTSYGKNPLGGTAISIFGIATSGSMDHHG